jgi:hypothetical protein
VSESDKLAGRVPGADDMTIEYSELYFGARRSRANQSDIGANQTLPDEVFKDGFGA